MVDLVIVSLTCFVATWTTAVEIVVKQAFGSQDVTVIKVVVS